MERAYTVAEIDSLRIACRQRWLYGTTAISGSGVSRGFRQNEMDSGSEELVRTYMLAGLVATDIYAADRPKPSANASPVGLLVAP